MAHRAGARARDLGSVSAKEGRFSEGKGFHRLPVAAFRPAALLGSVLDVSFQARAVPLPATIICPGGDSAKGQAAVASPYRLRSAAFEANGEVSCDILASSDRTPFIVNACGYWTGIG
jgi:hypothetical protein